MTTQPRVRDLGRWVSGGTPPKADSTAWDGEVPWISAKDIDGTRLREPTTFITEDAAKRYSTTVEENAIVVIVRGMALAHGLPVVLTRQRVAFNQDLRALVPRPGIHARFLHYAFIGHRSRFAAHIDKAAHGTARVIDSLYYERIRLPDLVAQQRIADFLDREAQRIADLARAAQVLGERVWQPVLSYVAEQTAGWSLGRISYSYDVQLGKMLDEKRIDPTDVRPYLRNSNVQWDRLDLTDLKTMTFDAADRRKFALRPGDLLVCEGGIVGRSAMWNGEVEDCYYQKALHRVRPRGQDSVRYLMWCLRLLSERGDFAADGTGSAILHLPAERLRATRVPLPPPQEQHAIAQRVDARALRATKIEQSVGELDQRLTEYREALIAEAVSGDLDVTQASEMEIAERAHAAVDGASL